MKELLILTGMGIGVVAVFYTIFYLVVALLVFVGSFTMLYTFSWFLALQVMIILAIARAGINFLFSRGK